MEPQWQDVFLDFAGHHMHCLPCDYNPEYLCHQSSKAKERVAKSLDHPVAIADLLVGALSLSISAAICLLIVHQVCIEHVCILDIFNVHSMYCLSMCSSVVSFDCDCLGWIHGGGKMDGLQDNRLQNPGHEVSHNRVVLSNISNSSFPDNGTVKCERCDLRKDLHHLVRLSSDCLNP